MTKWSKVNASTIVLTGGAYGSESSVVEYSILEPGQVRVLQSWTWPGQSTPIWTLARSEYSNLELGQVRGRWFWPETFWTGENERACPAWDWEVGACHLIYDFFKLGFFQINNQVGARLCQLHSWGSSGICWHHIHTTFPTLLPRISLSQIQKSFITDNSDRDPVKCVADADRVRRVQRWSTLGLHRGNITSKKTHPAGSAGARLH